MNQDSQDQGYTPARRVILLCTAWGATIIFTFPGVVGAAPFFPIGLPWLLGVALGHGHLGTNVEQVSVVLGWFIYIILSAATFITTRKAAYVTLYTILCVLLALNIVGCRLILNDLQHIR